MNTTTDDLNEMFLLNISSNCAQGDADPTESGVQAKIQHYLTKHGLSPTWQMAWGPVVVAVGTYPDCVLYLALDAATNRYFLSVAGTNFRSLLDIAEDIAVGFTLPWPYGSTAPLDVQVAVGTLGALDIYLAETAQQLLQPGTTTPASPTAPAVTLQDYLGAAFTTAAPGTFSIITGGHSLGGAVSPLLALWLTDTQAQWDSRQVVGSIRSYPSAGPTIGNEDFVAYYNQRVPATTRIYNKLDVVPRGWNRDKLNTIPALYEAPIPQSSYISDVIGRAEAKVNGIVYEQGGSIEHELPGQVNQDWIYKWLPHNDFGAAINFGMQASYQHINAYFDLLGIAQHKTPDIVVDPLAALTYWRGVVATLGLPTATKVGPAPATQASSAAGSADQPAAGAAPAGN